MPKLGITLEPKPCGRQATVGRPRIPIYSDWGSCREPIHEVEECCCHLSLTAYCTAPCYWPIAEAAWPAEMKVALLLRHSPTLAQKLNFWRSDGIYLIFGKLNHISSHS